MYHGCSIASEMMYHGCSNNTVSLYVSGYDCAHKGPELHSRESEGSFSAMTVAKSLIMLPGKWGVLCLRKNIFTAPSIILSGGSLGPQYCGPYLY